MDCFHPSALPVTISLFIIWPVVTLVYYGLTFRWAARLREGCFQPKYLHLDCFSADKIQLFDDTHARY